MRNWKLDILLENLNINCKYYFEDVGGTWCKRAWTDTDRECLKYTNCDGCVLKCELSTNDVIRKEA